MKPKNFPARKLARQIEALWRTGKFTGFVNESEKLQAARAIRTKKRRC